MVSIRIIKYCGFYCQVCLAKSIKQPKGIFPCRTVAVPGDPLARIWEPHPIDIILFKSIMYLFMRGYKVWEGLCVYSQGSIPAGLGYTGRLSLAYPRLPPLGRRIRGGQCPCSSSVGSQFSLRQPGGGNTRWSGSVSSSPWVPDLVLRARPGIRGTWGPDGRWSQV